MATLLQLSQLYIISRCGLLPLVKELLIIRYVIQLNELIIKTYYSPILERLFFLFFFVL